jgi:hypothetical protein
MAMQKYRRWLKKSDNYKYLKKQISKIIKIFHHNTVKFNKQTIIEEFQKSDKDLSVHLIFVTETLELSVNLSDI